HLQTGQLLGWALIKAKNWQRARAVLAGARAAFLVLFGQGLDEAEASDLISQAQALFAEAAFAAAQQGDLEAALDLLMEGKGRLMVAALNLQTLELPPDQRSRLETLRADIRDQTRTIETAHGTERGIALDKLAALRRQLLELIESAGSAEKSAGGALALARRLAPTGGAIAAPLITEAGGKLLIVAAPIEGHALSIIDLPELTSTRLTGFMKGPVNRSNDGWLGAYRLNDRLADLSQQISDSWWSDREKVAELERRYRQVEEQWH